MAPISYMHYQMMVFLGGLGVEMGLLLGGSCVADCVPLVAHVIACSLIFCCLCAITPRRRVCAKEQSFSRRVFAILFSWMRAVLFMSYVYWPCVGRLASHGEGGRDVNRGIVEGGAGVADGDVYTLMVLLLLLLVLVLLLLLLFLMFHSWRFPFPISSRCFCNGSPSQPSRLRHEALAIATRAFKR